MGNYNYSDIEQQKKIYSNNNTHDKHNTDIMPVKLIPLFYHLDLCEGNVIWELSQENNKKTLFIFNDNETRLYGKSGVAKYLRKYDAIHIKGINKIRSVGIPMNLFEFEEFKSLKQLIKYEFKIIPVQTIIDKVLSKIYNLLISSEYDQVKFFCHTCYIISLNTWIDSPNTLAKQTFHIPSDINNYIIDNLKYTI